MDKFRVVNFSNYQNIESLLGVFSHQTVINTMLSGVSQGEIYSDDLNTPEVVIGRFKYRAFLSGNPNPELANTICEFLKKELFPNCRQAEINFLKLSVNHSNWLAILQNALKDFSPMIADYQCYGFDIANGKNRRAIPEGFIFKPVNRALLEEHFNNKEALLDEMCSERETISSFLAHSFGICAIKQNELAGWCLSEYNHGDRCEVGIATLPDFQQKGLAKAMTRAFLDMAYSNGIRTVLWHCFKANEPSWKTALSVGFGLIKEEQLMLFDLR
jgi:ribosomal protein S18 acetylase RimI-like enzyme